MQTLATESGIPIPSVSVLLDEVTIKAACAALMQEIAPIDDMRSTAEYRLRVASNLLADFLSNLKTDGRASVIST